MNRFENIDYPKKCQNYFVIPYKTSEKEMVKMLDLDRHADCPLWEALASQEVPWTGLHYACLNVLHTYCKVFDKQEIYDLIVR